MGEHGFAANAEILVYTMPVGNIPMELYEGYISMLQAAAVIPISSLTRPGGYSAELSPFRSLSWESSQRIAYRFVDMNKTLSVPCEEVHATYRPLALVGICHCPTTENLQEAYHHFTSAAAQFPTTIAHKCFAFEHAFGAGTLDDVSTLDDLVMFPLAAPLADGHTTVTLHLQVVLDSLTVTILMSLESTIRAAMRQHQQTGATATSDQATTDAQLGLLHTQVDPVHEGLVTSSVALQTLPRATTPGRTLSGTHLPATPASGGTGLLALLEKEPRSRKRMTLRQRKLMGDYSVLLGCFEDALDFYVSALDGLREEERRSPGSFGDTLWLAAALEGYVTSMVLTMAPPFGSKGVVKLSIEVVEKASEAIALYGKAHCAGLEGRLIASMGWYYVAVHARLATQRGVADEATWVRQLALEAHARLVDCFPYLSLELRLAQLVAMAEQCAALQYARKQAFYLHEAATLLVYKHRLASPPRVADLRAALVLDQSALALLQAAPGWLHLRFYVLRQLVVVARACAASPESLVGHVLGLMELLADVATDADVDADTDAPATLWNDAFLEPFAAGTRSADERSSAPLHTKPHSAYYAPPPAFEKDVKKAATASFFGVKHLPTTMAVATTPRLLATPRQLMTAVMNVPTSFAASEPARDVRRPPADDDPAPRLELHGDVHAARWQQACWALLQTDVRCCPRTALPLLGRLLRVKRMTPLNPRPLVPAAAAMQVAAPESAKATFMYNPFQAKAAAASPEVVPTFALGDVVTIEVEIANPLAISLQLPQLLLTCVGAVFAYPAAVTLAPRQQGVVVALTLRPLAVGELLVEGCTCVLPQQTLRFSLLRPLRLEIVDAVPLAAWRDAGQPVTMFANETRVLRLGLRNLSVTHAMADVTLVVSLHRQTEGFHAPASVVVAANVPGHAALPDFAVFWDALPLPTLAKEASLLLPLRVHATKADVVLVKLRALHRGAGVDWFRDTTATFLVTVKPGVTVLGAPAPGHADVWNAADVPFVVDGWRVAPRSVARVQRRQPGALLWRTVDSSAEGRVDVPEPAPTPPLPWRLCAVLSDAGPWSCGCFYSVRLQATRAPESLVGAMSVSVAVTDARSRKLVPATVCMLAGVLTYTVEQPEEVHVIKVMFLQAGCYCVCATGSFPGSSEIEVANVVVDVRP
ncbi:hypothetical protein ACHHYP_17148 [Achlya hypogyna]|uniref:Uncharacterized protein n=1 Tax=Achlya hypogyna TaxID=1202772 RepID=A0A1V9Y512_ACHHY|nr:hypothetical protein ACHHYP_17148 [Achlya hypogyna]